MKIRWKRFLGGVLGLLGFTGCIQLFPAMYGSPSADFKLLGDVKDPDGKPIEGIRAVFRAVDDEEETWENDTLYTDVNGHFEKQRLRHDWPDEAQNASVKLEDVDGTAHGSFKTRIVKRSDMEVEQTKKGKKWYSGEFTIRVQAVMEKDN